VYTIDLPLNQRMIDPPYSQRMIGPPRSQRMIDPPRSQRMIDPPRSQRGRRRSGVAAAVRIDQRAYGDLGRYIHRRQEFRGALQAQARDRRHGLVHQVAGAHVDARLALLQGGGVGVHRVSHFIPCGY
jgi:hypothetical protein